MIRPGNRPDDPRSGQRAHSCDLDQIDLWNRWGAFCSCVCRLGREIATSQNRLEVECWGNFIRTTLRQGRAKEWWKSPPWFLERSILRAVLRAMKNYVRGGSFPRPESGPAENKQMYIGIRDVYRNNYNADVYRYIGAIRKQMYIGIIRIRDSCLM